MPGIEAIAEPAGGFGLAAELGDQRSRCLLAAGFECADQVVHHFPGCGMDVGGGVPVARQLGRPDSSI